MVEQRQGIMEMEFSATLLAACVPLSLGGFALVCQWLHRAVPAALANATRLTFGFAWLCTLIALVWVVAGNTAVLSLLSVSFDKSPVPIFGFLADRVSLVLLLLVVTVSGIVHLYSLRAMRDEAVFRRYFTLLTLVTAEVTLVVLANNLLMLCVFWILKGVTLTFLIAHYRERPESWRAALLKLRIDLVGDAAFLAALVLVWQIFGTVEIAAINRRMIDSPQSLPALQLTLITGLMLCAAMAKSAQFPLHRWLPESVEAPTPISALMHAGLINSGGFLFIRLSPLFAAVPLILLAAVIIGSITVVYSTLIMLTRNDVKGMLVYSTMGQMGFMIVECGLGAFALALFHIVAHGLYKANAFLGAGSLIQQHTQNLHPSVRRPLSGARLVLVGGVTAGLLLLVHAALGVGLTAGSLLLAFAWLTLFSASSRLLADINIISIVLGLVVLVPLYVLGIHAIELFFAPEVGLPHPAHPAVVGAVWAVLVGVGLTQTVVRQRGLPQWAAGFVRRLYVRSLFAGYGR